MTNDNFGVQDSLKIWDERPDYERRH